MALNTKLPGILKAQPGTGEFTARVRAYHTGKDAPEVPTPGSMVLWDRGIHGDDVSSASVFSKTGTVDCYDNHPQGQYFTTPTVTDTIGLTSFTLNMYRVNDPGTLRLDVYAIDGSNNPILPSLGYGTTNGTTLTANAAGEDREILMVIVPQLASATEYAAVLSNAGGASSTATINEDNSGTYGSGVVSSADGNFPNSTTWTKTAGKDLKFTAAFEGPVIIMTRDDGTLYQIPTEPLPT
jgi:hypothetical protein